MSSDDYQECIDISQLVWQLPVERSRYFSACSIFPEGQLVLRSGRGVEGFCSSLIVGLDTSKAIEDSWYTITGDGHLFTHKPEGKWLYISEATFREDIEIDDQADLFYFRLRLIAKDRGLDGIIYYYPVGEERDEEEFVRVMTSFYDCGFKAHSVTPDFRKRGNEMTTGLHFIWVWE